MNAQLDSVCVLVVEDDTMLQRLYQRLLEEAGATVLVASNGVDALRLVEAGAPFDVVVSDLAMPGIHGQVVLELIRQQRPSVPAVVASGWITPNVRQALEQELHARVLCKPIADPQLLVDAVAGARWKDVA